MSEAEAKQPQAAPRPSDDAIRSHMEEIAKEVRDSTPILGTTEPLDVLLEEYKGNDRFVPQILDLSKRYSGLQRSQGDGNCFYRAYTYAWFQSIRGDAAKVDEAVVQAKAAASLLIDTLGYPKFTVEDFMETFVEEVEALKGRTADEVLAAFKDQGISQYLMCFSRMITSAHIQSNGDQFLPFVMALRPEMLVCKDFTAKEVEPMGVDADQLQITALTDALGVGVQIEYLDGNGDSVTHHNFPNAVPPTLHLLYRPGHYDLLVPKEQQQQ